MSISAMTNAALARRPDFAPLRDVPRTLADIAKATAPPSSPNALSMASDAAAGGPPINDSLQVISTYIPTEVITLYIAFMSVLAPATPGSSVLPLDSSVATTAQWMTFIGFIIVTPMVVWIVFATKLRTVGKPLPMSVAHWPKWEMSAATLAFCAWAFALPSSPLAHETWYSPGLAGLLVPTASTCLGLLAPLFQRSLTA